MSHVATIALEFRDAAALADAVTACGASLNEGPVTFYDGTRVTGQAVHLPGWRYPIVVDAQGRLFYDHYQGRWGDPRWLDRFRQAYAEAGTARFARTQGYRITRTTEADGTVRLALTR
jgi:hypothetical protein